MPLTFAVILNINITITLSAKSSIILRENKAAFCREGHDFEVDCECDCCKSAKIRVG